MANAAMAQSQYFTPTKYRGAFAPAPTAQWTNGWTNWDPQNTDYNPTSKPVIEISGNITASRILSSDKIYKIVGTVYVKNNAILTIKAGTVIMGDAAGASLVITRGAKINAIGTATSPIVFTSDKPTGQRAAGNWGGLILLGKATNNKPAGADGFGVGNIEGLTVNADSEYGGNDDADNSGTLKFVRIEYSGFPLQPNQEINGLTMGSVGSGTVIENIQVSYNQDDSFEWFGGTVNAKNLVSYRTQDDDFDTDNGYRGNIQFGLALRDPSIADVSGSSSFESDNDGTGSDATPKTAPVFSNMTVIGPLRGNVASSVNSNHKRNGRLRRNTNIKVLNSVLMDAKTAIFIDALKAEANFQSGAIVVAGNVIAGYPTNKLAEVTTDSGKNPNANIGAVRTTLGNNNDTIPTTTAGILTTPYNFTAPDYRPASGSIALTGSQFSHSAITSLVKTLPATQLKEVSRNVTVASMSTIVYADAVFGASGYRFKITDVNTSEEQVFDASSSFFTFAKLLSKKFNTTYSVQVAAIYGSVVQNYGAAWNVTTPSPNTTISNAVCDNQLEKFDDLVFANRVTGVSKYRFIVDNGSGLRDSVEASSNFFRFTSIFTKNAALAKYATTYNVSVKTLADGNWTAESTACPVTLPELPVVSFTNGGSTLTTNLQLANFTKVYGATYKVYLYNANDDLIDSSAVSTSNYTRFASFSKTKLNTVAANGVYKMAVKYLIDGTWSVLSEKATFTRALPSSLATKTTTTVAFPNPFNSSFAIVLDRESNDKVNVSISDLTGKIVEVATLEAENVSSSVLGEHLTPGVYTITVNQGTFVEKIKAIKTEK